MVHTQSHHHLLTPALTRLLAVAAGLVVANIYYNQSVLHLISVEFGATSAQVSTIAIATQLGYASGLLLLVPLGDILNRKWMIVWTALLAALILLAVVFAPSLNVVILASYLVGLISITPQLIVPYAAGMADASRRGKIVGTVMAGLLVGILLSRSVAGFLGAWFGWRMVFGLGALLSFGIGLALCLIPHAPSGERGTSYGKLIVSLFPLLVREPILRRHSVIGFLGFASFSAFWTTLAFYLADRPEHYGSQVVGMFALVAVVGAVVAPISGHLSDRFSAQVVNGVSLVVLIIGFLVMGFSDFSLAWLVLGVFLMDAGVQANQISNQTRIYTLSPQLRSRITSIYMFIYFLGGAFGSLVGSHAWAWWGWTGVWGSGTILGLLALIPLYLKRL